VNYTSSNVYRVGDLLVDVDRVSVTRDGETLALARLSFNTLLALIKIAPAVATIEYLLKEVWGGLVVNDDTVAQRIKLLRAALDDDSRQPRYLQVVRGHGYRLIPDVSRPDIPPVEPPAAPPAAPIPAVAPFLYLRRRARVLLVACVLLLAGALIVVPIELKSRTDSAATTQSRQQTVAVLPFESVGPEAAQSDYLASGMAESILHVLAGTPRITVISRESSFSFKGHDEDVREIGRRLNAGFLLEGSLQRSGRQLRMRTALVDAGSGENVWSLNFDRPLTDVLAVQDEIAAKVAHALSVTLHAGADERREGRGTTKFDAYLEYLQGRELAQTYRLPDLQGAVAHYERAAQIDPGFSAAYSGLAWTRYQMLAFRTSDATQEDWAATQAEVRRLLDEALALDDRNADAWQARAAVETDPERSELDGRRAVALEPSLARAQFGLAQVVLQKTYGAAPERMDEAIALMRKAILLDPLEPRYPTALAGVYVFQRTTQVDQAEPLYLHALELDPNYFPALYALGALRFCCEARIADGIRDEEKALALDPTSTAVRGILVHMYLDISDDDTAERLLATSDRNKSAWVAIHAYRHEWSKAAAIMYDAHMRANLPIAPDGKYGNFAVLMSAADEESRARAQRLLEELTHLTWRDGKPILPIPMNDNMDREVDIGALLLRANDRARARELLEAVLAAMDTAATQYQRGETWFSVQRMRALALLGRSEEALRTLPVVSRSGWSPDSWMLEVDPACDSIRADPRFQAFLEERRLYRLQQRTRVEQMRAKNDIPGDLRWR
jgi:TolB-like protein/DNA-binding winged helix-turn-helix (wHTH) protein/tetratricopeptide (TPR) repeat protein